MLKKDIKFMEEAIRQAKKGIGKVSPNPLVGAVIVKNGTIIGRGYHSEYGKEHAEVSALNNCRESVKGCDLYVTLEPCDHHGKTPPCSDMIIKNDFARVVTGAPDPSENAGGASIKKFRESGIEVVTGILEQECKELNRPFYHYMDKKTPYIVLKTASSLDGSVACDTGDSKWITCEESRKKVHLLRNQYDAVLTGKGTVLQDDPELTVRNVKGRNPVRIVVDKDLELPVELNIFKSGSKVYIITDEGIDPKKETKYKELSISLVKVKQKNGVLNISEAFSKLGIKGIRSIMIEAGPYLTSYLLKNKLVNRINLFIAPVLIGSSKKFFTGSSFKMVSESISVNIDTIEKVGSDIFIDGTPEYTA